MTPPSNDKNRKKKKKNYETNRITNDLHKDSKFLTDEFDNIERSYSHLSENDQQTSSISQEGEKQAKKTSIIQKNWENFVHNTKNVVEKWESNWKELNQSTKEKRKQNKKRFILGEKINQGLTNVFFKRQQRAFNQKLEELEGNILKQPLSVREKAQYRRLKRKQKWHELVDQGQQLSKQRRQERQELRNEKQTTRKEFVQTKKNLQKDIYEEKKLNRQQITKEKREKRIDIIQQKKKNRKELSVEKQKKRKENWKNFVRIQQRKTQRFMKFQNRLWWKGYMQFLLQVIMIVAFILFLFWIFQQIGINLIDLFQTMAPDG